MTEAEPPVEPLTAEEEANLRAKDAMLEWSLRRGSLWVKRMTEDWQTATDEELIVHRLLATLAAARSQTPEPRETALREAAQQARYAMSAVLSDHGGPCGDGCPMVPLRKSLDALRAALSLPDQDRTPPG